MTKTLLGAGTLACALLTSTALTAPAFAQAAQPYRAPDANGVDVVHGDYLMEVLEGSIGSGVAELQLIRTGLWVNGVYGSNSQQWDRIGFQKFVVGGAPHYVVTLGARSETFTNTATLPSGSSLSGSNNSFVYSTADGTTIAFSDAEQGGWGTDSNLCTTDPAQGDCELVPVTITEPSGRAVAIAHSFWTECWGFIDAENLPCTFRPRIAAVTNGFGYSIAFDYEADSWTGNGATWYQRTGATFHNGTVSGNPAQGSVGYAYPSAGVTEVTDMGGRVWRFTGTSGAVTGIRRPGASSDTTTIAYSGGRVSSVVNEGVTTTYARSDSGSTGTMTITAVDGDSGTTDPVTTVVSNLTIGRPSSITDPLNRTTGFQYDSSARLTRVTRPEGNYVEYSYDTRGNVTQTRWVAKAGSGLADMVTTASYDSSCANPVTCNSPNSTTDARGNVTDYTYDSTHGGVLTVTAPAPSGSGTRPQTRYTYELANGEYRLHYVSVCATGSDPSCLDTADESRTVLTHDANGNVTSVEQRSGNTSGTGALSATTAMTYDARGDLLTVDGPLPGTADTNRLRYNAARQTIGAIGPDPDGASPLKHRAVRITYTNGLPIRQETGTVDSQSDGDWAAFTGLEEVQQSYDANARPTLSRLVSGSTTYALSQTSYDGLGRVRCTAQRMNPSEFASLPSDACTLDTEGSHGPDRIARTSYDLAGQVTGVETGVGVSGVAADEATTSYRANGQLETLTDANGNMTTYVFDGHDRLSRTRMPALSTPGTSSTTDYEELIYLTATVANQARSTPLIASRRLRDGNSIAYGYDALGRLTSKDLPGTEATVTYGYDLMSRATLVEQDALGHTLTFTHDALGRLLSQTDEHGLIYYNYDAAGRRIHMTWPDSFWVSYDYLVTGEVSAIREYSGTLVLGGYGYDDLGRRTSISRYNGTSTSFDYDPASRLDELVQNLTGTSSDLTLNFTHNPAGQLASNTRSNDAFSFTGHANLNQVGTPNGLNQLTAVGGTSISHDGRGNVAAIGSAGYYYSAENRLTHGPASAAFVYDPLGRLYYSYSTALGSTYFQYDGQNLATEYGSSGAVLRRYVHGPGVDEPLVWYEGSGTGTRRWFHADERGSVIAVSDASGSLVGSNPNRYDEYGMPQGAPTGRFGYTGQMFLPEIGMYHYRNRTYNPNLGRFMQTDPIGYGAGTNLYTYVRNDPVNFTDPLGLREQCMTFRERGGGPSAEGEDGPIVTGGRLRLACWTAGGNEGGSGPTTYFDGLGVGGPTAENFDCPNGIEMSVNRTSRGRTNISMSASVSFQGPGAANSASSYLSGIPRTFNVTDGSYSMSLQLRNGNGFIGYVTDNSADRELAYGEEGRLVLPDIGTSAATQQVNIQQAAHGFAHMFGMIDRYKQVPGHVSVWPGYERSIMGVGYTGSVNAQTMKDAITACQAPGSG